MPRITRRHALAGAAALAALRPGTGRAQLLAERGGLATVSDGALGFPDLGAPTPDATAEEVAALRAAAGVDAAALRPVTVTLWRDAGRVVLFDAGGGPQFVPTVGRLEAALDAAGVAVDDVTDILLTHAHPDHLWGVLNDFDEPTFPNAALHVARAEHDWWLEPATLDGAPEFRVPHVIGARNRFAAMADRIAFFEPGAEPVPGVTALATPGHTPGHVSFLIAAADALVAGDAVTDPALSIARPRWRSAVDTQPEVAAETRAALLDRLAGTSTLLIGYHLPEPNLHRVARDGEGYALSPA